MAELATIARPYAEALFKADGVGDPARSPTSCRRSPTSPADPQLRQFADDPKVTPEQVFDLVTRSRGRPARRAQRPAANLLRTVIDNGRLVALPEIAAQYHALVNGALGHVGRRRPQRLSDRAAQLGDVVAALEKRFGRKLNASVVIDPTLIGGIRVVVGDEVLDTSIKARLEQMRAALTA